MCACSVTQSCPALCDPMDCSLPDSSVHGIFQARILQWVAISSSRGSFRPRDFIYSSVYILILCLFLLCKLLQNVLLSKKKKKVIYSLLIKKKRKYKNREGTSLVVQWLTFHLPTQGIWVQSLVRELRSHMPLVQKTKV